MLHVTMYKLLMYPWHTNEFCEKTPNSHETWGTLSHVIVIDRNSAYVLQYDHDDVRHMV